MTEQPERRVVGKALPRRDAYGKVTGRSIYAMDFTVPGMLHGAILRSPHPYARIKYIDTSRAREHPLVHAVLTQDDLPKQASTSGEQQQPTRYGDIIQDNTLMAKDFVRYAGQPVAIVAADTEAAALAAVKLINVAYDVLIPVLDAEAALLADAPLVHQNWQHYEAPDGMGRDGNICSRTFVQRGNVDEAFANADVVVERHYKTTIQHQGHTEPRVAVASVDEQGVLTIHTTTQLPFNIRNIVARLLSRPVSSVRIVGMTLGGGFGSKLLLGAEGFAAALTLAVGGRPVRMLIPVSDDLRDGYPRHPSHTTVRAAVQHDGTITALQGRVILDAGAFSGSSPGLAAVATLVLAGPYRIPNLDVEGTAVYTNKMNFGPMRAPSGPQAAFAIESLMDEIAEALDMDPVSLRLQNIVDEGDLGPTGQELTGVSMREVLTKAAKAIEWEQPAGPNRGKGLAINWWTTTGGSSGVYVKLNSDGTVLLTTGAVDIGTGAISAGAAQVLAEELAIDVNDIIIGQPDTGSAPFDYGAQGSRTTVSVGRACMEAAADLRDQLFELASELLQIPKEALILEDKAVRIDDAPYIHKTLAELASFSENERGGLIGRGTYIMPKTPFDDSTTTNHWYPTFNSPSFHCHAVEVVVDPETGDMSIDRYVAVQDAGFAINPGFVTGQIQGGATQAIGFATSEEIVYGPDGHVVNNHLTDYKMPTIADVPRVEAIIVETAGPYGPYGAKGVGEPAVVAGPAAIANAVKRACGARVRILPITGERLWQTMKEQG